MMRMSEEVKKSVRLLVPAKSNDGTFLETVAGSLLKRQRYNIVERVRFTGMEIDLIADNVDTSQRVFVECKFVQDPLSANVIDLIIGKAVRKNIKTAYLFSTAPLGKEARGVMDELKQDQRLDAPKLAFVGPEDIAEMFVDIYDAEPDLQKESKIASATLILTPQLPAFWVLEVHQNGIPQQAILQPVKDNMNLKTEEINKLFEDHSIYQGLELVYANLPRDERYIKMLDTEEIVTLVPVADSLDDYRPCKPEHFVGRHDVQKNIWDFFELVRQNRTNTRILALSGPSGFGKSSVVLKLAQRFRNQKWMNKLYLYPIDVRSAKGPLFVAKALKTAMQTAIDDGFIRTPSVNITIESTESFLQSESIQQALNSLQADKRVLVVFFDQFEELFTKEELLATFETFKKMAFEVHSAQANLVIGFSWRTGITLSDENPAYHMWHDLRDLRKSIVLSKFESGESSQLLTQFERELSEKLLPPLRRRLLEQGQGLPWLLKKLSIHIYREIIAGTQQEDLLSRRLNIKSLFDEDLEPLTTLEIKCLHYVAERSPVDVADVIDSFDQAIVNQLYNRRLIVRAGQKYAVYWDIFRDYLVDGTIPAIPWTYVPQASISAIIRAFDVLKENGPLDLAGLSNKLGIKESTGKNIITDLQNLLLSNRDVNGMYQIRQHELLESGLSGIAGFLVEQMKEHIVMQSIYNMIDPGKRLSMEEFRQVIADSYVAANLGRASINIYLNRLLPWFRFVGLLNYSEFEGCIMRPQGIGDEFGKIEINRRRGARRTEVFMISSTPQGALNLAKTLIVRGHIKRDEVLKSGNRNAACDLRA